MDISKRNIALIVLLGALAWFVGRGYSQPYQPDTTYYMVEMLHYSGTDYANACEMVYTSDYALNSGWVPQRINGLRNVTNCVNQLGFYNRRILYPYLTSYIYRATGSMESMGVLPLLAFLSCGVLLYWIFHKSVGENPSLFYSLVFLMLPIILIRVGARYLTDGISLSMWLLCTLVYLRHVREGRGLGVIFPLLLLYLLVRDNALFLVISFIMASAAVGRRREALSFAAFAVVLLLAQNMVNAYMGSYSMFDHYLYQFHSKVPLYYVRPEVPLDTLLTTHITLVFEAFVGVSSRLLYHTHVFLLLAAAGLIWGRKRGGFEYVMFSCQIASTMLLFFVFPYPDSRYIVYAVPGILYLSHLGWLELNGKIRKKLFY